MATKKDNKTQSEEPLLNNDPDYYKFLALLTGNASVDILNIQSSSYWSVNIYDAINGQPISYADQTTQPGIFLHHSR